METLLVLLAVIGGGVLVHLASRHASNQVPTGPSTDVVDALERRVAQLEELVDMLPVKWEEIAKQAKRSEDRARAVVRRAKAELEEAGYEHEGVEAEARDLFGVDEDGSGEGGVRDVRPDVGNSREPSPGDGEEWPGERATFALKHGIGNA